MFFKIESWNFQHLFEIEFRETSKNFNSFSTFRQLFCFFLSVVWLSWNFVRFLEILFQTDDESFSFLSWKTKKFYSYQWRFWVFPVKDPMLCIKGGGGPYFFGLVEQIYWITWLNLFFKQFFKHSDINS